MVDGAVSGRHAQFSGLTVADLPGTGVLVSDVDPASVAGLADIQGRCVLFLTYRDRLPGYTNSWKTA